MFGRSQRSPAGDGWSSYIAISKRRLRRRVLIFRGINNDRRIYINIDDSMGLLKERRRLLDLDLRLLHRRDRGRGCEPGAAVVNLSARARGPGRSQAAEAGAKRRCLHLRPAGSRSEGLRRSTHRRSRPASPTAGNVTFQRETARMKLPIICHEEVILGRGPHSGW